MIENQTKELTLLYHSDKAEDKKARAFVEGMKGYTIKTLDLKKDHLTETQLAEIADKMNVTVTSLFDPTYQDHFQASNPHNITSADDADLLTILIREPILINSPITIIGKKAYLYAAAYELLTKNIETEIVSPAKLKEEKIVF